jgi:hypothetical protein
MSSIVVKADETTAIASNSKIRARAACAASRACSAAVFARQANQTVSKTPATLTQLLIHQFVTVHNHSPAIP